MSRKSISDDVGYGDVAPESCADRLMKISESKGIERERGGWGEGKRGNRKEGISSVLQKKKIALHLPSPW